MSVLRPLLLRGLRGPLRQLQVPRAQVYSKPPREQLGILDMAIGLTSCFVCFFLPAGWVLSHLDNYKKRE